MFISLSPRLFPLVFASSLLVPVTLQAAITWGLAVTITGDADVFTGGDLEYAYRFENSTGAAGPVVVSGVTFASISGTGSTSSPYVHTVSGNTVFTFAPLNSSPVLSTNHQYGNGRAIGVDVSPSMTSNYISLLGGYIFAGGANFPGTVNGRRNGYTLTMNGLEIGKEYSVQVWFNDSRLGTGNRRGAIQDGPAIDYNVSAATVNGGLGQYAIGTFVASGTTESFVFLGFTDDGIGAQLNAFQLRVIPEPSSMMLAGLSTFVLAARRRRL